MSKYDIDLELENRNSLSILLQHIQKNSTVLEFGPANGRLTRYLKNELGCRVYAVEIDETATVHLEPYCEDLIVGDIESYGWKKRFEGIRFDTIVFADVLEHLYTPQKVLMEAKAFLKENGTILVSLPNIAHNSIIMELLEDKFTYRPTGLLDNTHIRFFTHSSFLEAVEQCGLFCTYESGVYARANETEFGYHYDDFELGRVLEEREFGEVYQFVYALKTAPVREKISDFNSLYQKEKMLGIAKLYVDTGNGFWEDESIEIKNPQMKELLEFDLSQFTPIKGLRFDPYDSMVGVGIRSTVLMLDDQTSQDIVSISDNSICMDSGNTYFLNNDSQYIYLIDETIQSSLQKVVIVCHYDCFKETVIAKVEECLLRQSHELHKIKNSKVWKLILLLKKIRSFFYASN